MLLKNLYGFAYDIIVEWCIKYCIKDTAICS